MERTDDDDVLPVPVGFNIALRRRNYHYDVYFMYSMLLIFMPLSVCQLNFASFHLEYFDVQNSLASLGSWFIVESLLSNIFLITNLIFFAEYKTHLLFRTCYNLQVGFQFFWLIVGCDFLFNITVPFEAYALLWFSLIIGYARTVLEICLIAIDRRTF